VPLTPEVALIENAVVSRLQPLTTNRINVNNVINIKMALRFIRPSEHQIFISFTCETVRKIGYISIIFIIICCNRATVKIVGLTKRPPFPTKLLSTSELSVAIINHSGLPLSFTQLLKTRVLVAVLLPGDNKSSRHLHG
jgi:hypothetical protein